MLPIDDGMLPDSWFWDSIKNLQAPHDPTLDGRHKLRYTFKAAVLTVERSDCPVTAARYR
jgi:hypothetical protein